MIIPTTGQVSLSLLAGNANATGNISISKAGNLFDRVYDVSGTNSLRLSEFFGSNIVGDPNDYPDNQIYYMNQLANAAWDSANSKWSVDGNDYIQVLVDSGSNALKIGFYMSYLKYKQITAATDFTAQDFTKKLTAIANHPTKLPVLIRFVLCFERLGMQKQVYGRDYYNPTGYLNYYDYSELDEWGNRPENYNGRVPFTLADTTIVDYIVDNVFGVFVDEAYKILGKQLKWVSTGMSSADEFGYDLQTRIYDTSENDSGQIANYFTTFAYHPANILKFRNFLTAKYGTIGALNSSWSTSYTNFNEIPLPATGVDNMSLTTSSGNWANLYNTTRGKDFYLYRHNNLAEFSLKIKNRIKTVSPKIKYMIEIGNSTGKNAVLQGTLIAPYYNKIGAEILKSMNPYAYGFGITNLLSSPSWGYMSSMDDNFMYFGDESAQFDPYVSNNAPLMQQLLTEKHSASLARGATICLLLGDPNPGDGNKYLDYWKYVLNVTRNLRNQFGLTPKTLYKYSPTVNVTLSQILSGTREDADYLKSLWDTQNRTIKLTAETGIDPLLTVTPVSSSQVYDAFPYLREVPTITGAASAICDNGGVKISVSLNSFTLRNSTRYEYLYYIGKDVPPTDPLLFSKGFNGRITVNESFSAPSSSETWYVKIIHRTYGTIFWQTTVTVPACANFPTVTTSATCVSTTGANVIVSATGGSGTYQYASYISSNDCTDGGDCASKLTSYLNGTSGWRTSMSGNSYTFGPVGNTIYYFGIRDSAGNSGITSRTINCNDFSGDNGGISGVTLSVGLSCGSQSDGTGVISAYVSSNNNAYYYKYGWNSTNHGGYLSAKTQNTSFTFPTVYDDDYSIFIYVYVDGNTSSYTQLNWNGNPLTVACLPRQLIITSVTTGCNGVGSNVGTLSINTKYGVGPYQYTIDGGINWQTNNVFYNLASNANINGNLIQVKDIGFSNSITSYNGVASIPNCNTVTLSLAASNGTCQTNGIYYTGLSTVTLTGSGGTTYTYFYKFSTDSNWIQLSSNTMTVNTLYTYDFKVESSGATATIFGWNSGCPPYQWPPSILYMECISSPTRVQFHTQTGTSGTTINLYQYSTDGSSWTSCPNPTTIGTGTYYFRVRASDGLYSSAFQYTVSC
jgi:hypothetical protein